MTSDLMSTSIQKKRRIMIITGDESIIEQIQNSNNSSSLIKSYIIEPKENNTEICYSPVRKSFFFVSAFDLLYVYIV
jgi:hypothetical protein